MTAAVDEAGQTLARGADDSEKPAAPRIRPGGPSSIRILLSAASLLFLALMIGLGVFSIQRLSDVNRLSDEIRNQWLQDIRLIGDLNNYMSDYRTGEGTHLLSGTAAELMEGEKEIAGLDARVIQAQRSYEALPHEESEQRLYDEFAREWAAYKVIAAQVLVLSHSGAKSAAVAMYMTDSRRAFDMASDTLGRLTDQTVAKSGEASSRAAGAYSRDRRLIVAAMIVATCLVLATIIYITRSVSRPLLGLARGMHDLAAHHTDISIPGSGRDDEIGEMARSVSVFRDNAIALVHSQRRLIEQTAALEETLENERRVAAQQRNFVTMTSHEFRTPLTVIDAQAQRLIKLKDRVTPSDLLERATRIRGAVTRLTGIMDSLLGASRMLDGQAVYQPGNFDPAGLLHEVCQLHRDTTRSADIREKTGELPSVMYGDPKLLFALFSNLLSNAIKYSAPGDPVEMTAREEHGGLLVSVSDHGIGIPERDRAHLFERYFRGANAAGVAGSGVGLHLVAMVLELHGGSIEVDSREGAGSSFTVRIPISSRNS
ncbi:MAG TPA: ATP-binding protein [Steroidobacteraceae bacterium]|nr:ATP-binding protein [Steroidobacteraceae bacterium]